MTRSAIAVLAVACEAPRIGSSPPPETSPPIPTITEPAAPCDAEVVDAGVEPLPNPLAKRLVVGLDAPAAAWAVCRPDDDPDEALLVESGALEKAHRLDVTGLYADVLWRCEVTPACRGAASTRVDLKPAVPAELPSFAATGAPSGAWTLLATNQGAFADGRRDVLILDPEGRARWHAGLVERYRADIDTSWTGEVVHIGGGWGLFEEGLETRGLVLQLDLAGREVHRRDVPVFGEGYNHHSEPLPSGEVLSLTGTFHEVGGQRWRGVAIERLDPATDAVTWSWDSHDLVDSGVEGPFANDNPWNANALEWTTDAAGEALWVSLYTGQALWRIDPATGERTHVLGHDGDFAFVDVAGDPLPPAELVYGQHGPDFGPDGRVILYDNGVGRPGGDQSRVVELRVDPVAGTATLLWQWTEDGWYTPIIGDADYLPSGNVLVTKGVVQALTPFRSQQSAVIEIDPTTDEVRWRLEATQRPSPAIYRSEQYDGCAIFRSARHCPAVADRIGVLESP